jgi:hypothetical protein
MWHAINPENAPPDLMPNSGRPPPEQDFKFSFA